MGFQLKDFLDAVGPPASLIFAAWIFLSVLQQRYSDAYERYRALVQQYREPGHGERRRESVKHQILLYLRRCEQMRRATNIGVVAAMLLILALMTAGVDVVVGSTAPTRYAVAVLALLGLALVIVAAGYMVFENTLVRQALSGEPDDIPELRRVVRQTEEGAEPAGGNPAPQGS
jgi:hypothetical protein